MDKLLNKPGYLLLAGGLLMLYLAYQFAFKQTLEALQANRQLHAQLESGEDLVAQPGFTKRKSLNLERALELYKVDTATFRSTLITTMSLLAEKHSLRMTDIPTVADTASDSQQHRVILQGSYHNMIRFLNDAEKIKGYGQLRSVEIYSEKNSAIEKTDLKLQIYFIGI
ncbi:hypothetical protein LJ707_10465 [Mucilaginibacter sp. UR6-1]|uniref:hypothetical protein n=1 Tax=Mucilaginibacter sp. UR6-1 TaxID=1435643 RepID=UPI001E4512FD|nr:hypothetical protein [Mucilaginibacter sp. UR6-1]MCC8409356.1 hypothetical protein [Mucilaginibacter sp. UR6-1]